MGNISNYARVLASKLQDVFVCDQTDSNVTTTKSVTVEQIGDAICGEQVHSDLKTDNQTIIGGINELAKDKNVADEYDDTHTYNTGDVTIYGNTLYICTTNNTTGTFDPSKWTATTVQSLIGDLSELTTSVTSSLVGAVNEVNGAVGAITHPTKIWSGAKYTLNDYIDIPDFDKDTMYMFEFKAFSGTYHTAFISAVGDGYLQFIIWGDNTQHCRYRIQINTNSGRLTIVDVTNGGANQALIALYAFA